MHALSTFKTGITFCNFSISCLPARTVLCLILFSIGSHLYAQQPLDNFTCGTPESVPENPDPSLTDQCFNVADVQANCTQVWIRVNAHFFLNDDCTGSIHPLAGNHIPAEDAYEVAEDMINRANAALADNKKQWQQDPQWGIFEEKPAQCMPVRYLLSGVYIHCDTEAKQMNGANLGWFQDHFGVNTGTEFNVYFAKPNNSNGIASGIPGTSMASEHFGVDVFNHEFGHLLGLYHTFINDDIDDTPMVTFTYDFNCDGDLLDNFPNGVGPEFVSRKCWIFIGDADPPVSLDYDGDGIVDYNDLCDMDDPCVQWPCCSWDYQNNNIMTYSAYMSAYTEGQITRILQILSKDEYCEFIEQVGSVCRPPSPNIHVLPGSEEDGCSFCLQLEASMHDKSYMLNFYDENGGLHYSTGWKDGPASRFCISRSLLPPYGYRYGFEEGTLYTAELTVENKCGDQATESLTFTLSEAECDGPAHPSGPNDDMEFLSIYPNPSVDVLNIAYKLNKSGQVSFSLYSTTANNEWYMLEEKGLEMPGEYQSAYSLTGIPSGNYYLVLSLDGSYIYDNIVKY